MLKQTIQYGSDLDALVAVAKRLSRFEAEAQMDSESFFDRYTKGQLSDDIQLIEWANDYRHYLSLREVLEKRLTHAA